MIGRDLKSLYQPPAAPPGEVVLDLGAGGGFDVFIAARKVGPTGRAIGVDMTPEMLAKADEIRILEIAVEREIVANRTYLEMAASAQSAVAKEMFLALAKEEETHAKILRAEVDSIGRNGFWFDMQEFTMEQ